MVSRALEELAPDAAIGLFDAAGEARGIHQGRGLHALPERCAKVGKPRQVRGRPMAADETLSRKIVSDLTRLSQPFGTEIEYVDGVGVVRLKSSTTN